MTDNPQTPIDEPAIDESTDQQPPLPTKPGWRERTLGMRGVAAVTLAGLILGGLGGAAIGVVASGDDDDAWRPPDNFERQGPPDGGRGG
ncbi:MAG: hypothetical protein WC642_09270, partial [Nocardioides sp.]